MVRKETCLRFQSRNTSRAPLASLWKSNRVIYVHTVNQSNNRNLVNSLYMGKAWFSPHQSLVIRFSANIFRLHEFLYNHNQLNKLTKTTGMKMCFGNKNNIKKLGHYIFFVTGHLRIYHWFNRKQKQGAFNYPKINKTLCFADSITTVFNYIVLYHH